MVDPGELPEETAIREFTEETLDGNDLSEKDRTINDLLMTDMRNGRHFQVIGFCVFWKILYASLRDFTRLIFAVAIRIFCEGKNMENGFLIHKELFEIENSV